MGSRDQSARCHENVATAPTVMVAVLPHELTAIGQNISSRPEDMTVSSLSVPGSYHHHRVPRSPQYCPGDASHYLTAQSGTAARGKDYYIPGCLPSESDDRRGGTSVNKLPSDLQSLGLKLFGHLLQIRGAEFLIDFGYYESGAPPTWFDGPYKNNFK